MASGLYLAMTAAEFANADVLPPKNGWLTDPAHRMVPEVLGAGSLLILTDQQDVLEMDRLSHRLTRTILERNLDGIVLDFQKQRHKNSQDLAEHLAVSLPCPVAVSEGYAAGLDCPVFLSPCPHHTHLKDHIAPWKGRELWLDLAVDAEVILLKKEGCDIFPLPLGEIPEGGHAEKDLHCHYKTQTGVDFARFTLWRTRDDLEEMAKEAQQLGIHTLVGLWCEWQAQI